MKRQMPIITRRNCAVPVAAALLSWTAGAADELTVIDSPDKAASAQTAEAGKLGRPVEWLNTVGMTFRLIPAGEFTMGHAADGQDAPPHRVRLTKPFYLGCFEVTRAQWEAVAKTKHSDYFPGADLPMNCISMTHANAFIAALNTLEGLEYRLPTEAEWEYAARAGSATAYPGGDTVEALDKVAWYDGNDGGTLHPVGQKAANAFGLHDMHGNAWEWCSDFYDPDYYAVSPLENPTGPAITLHAYRVLRGGAAFFNALSCRSAKRNYFIESRTTKLTGFRVLLPITDKSPAKSPAKPQAAKGDVK